MTTNEIRTDIAAPSQTGPAWVTIEPGPAERRPREYQRQRMWLERSLAIAIPVIALLAWQICSSVGIFDARFFPPPTKIIEQWATLIENGMFYTSLAASVQRIVLGYIFGAIAALIIAWLIAPSRLVRNATEPTIIALYTVPKLSILPLLLLIFGIGELSKTLLVALTVFFVVLINTIDAVAGVSSKYLDVGRAAHASRWSTLWNITLPASLPQTLTGLRISAGMAVLVIVGAEFVAANEGLGYLIWNSWAVGIPSRMFVGIVTISVLGVLANALIRLLGRVLTPWTRVSMR